MVRPFIASRFGLFLAPALALGIASAACEQHDASHLVQPAGLDGVHPSQSVSNLTGKVALEASLPPHPESALLSPDGSAYLVSNLGAGTGAGPVPHLFDENDNGFISKVEVEADGGLGAVTTDWISSGTTGADVDGITGIAVWGTDLYAVDRDEILVFDVSDLSAPTFTMSIALPSPGDRVLPNDIIVRSDGTLYLTDTGLDRNLSPTSAQSVWRLPAGGDPATDWELLASFSGDQLVCPNGVSLGGPDTVLFVTFCSAELFEVDETSSEVRKLRTFRGRQSVAIGRLDGIVNASGTLFISDWRGLRNHVGAVHRVGNPQAHRLVSNLFRPADIGFDGMRDRVLIPSDGAQSLRVAQLRP